MTPRWLWLVPLLVAFVGAAIGSFLNVVIVRLPRGESIVTPGSRCPGCKAPIAWHDNIPILSWLLLRGRCRRCGMRIPVRYPVVEACGAALALAAWRRFGLGPDGVAVFAFFAFLLAITYIDLEHWLVMHALTWPGIAAGLLASLLTARITFLQSALGAAVGFAAFWMVELVGRRLFKKEAMGGGDKWLLAMIGSFVGLRALLPVIFLSSLAGAVVGLLLIAVRRGRPPPPPPELPPAPGAEPEAPWTPPAHAVPFGPFLALAAMVVVLFEGRLGPLTLFPR